jgi:GT2 family glycosyltransferase
MVDLSIVIVSWNVESLLKKCLQSIYENQGDLSLEVFVVDNNSSDQTVAMIQSKFPEVKLIKNKKNEGFARANNQAIKQARGEYVLLLNPDTEIVDKALDKSLRFMKDSPRCGIMGPKMLFADKSVQPSVRNLPTVWPIFLMLLKVPKILPHLKSIDKYLSVGFDYSRLQEVKQVMGAYMFMSKQALDEVGLLDERFFIWFEEVDLCKRMLDNGKIIMYNPEVVIIHHGGESFSQQGVVKKQLAFFKSAYKYFIKHGF